MSIEVHKIVREEVKIFEGLSEPEMKIVAEELTLEQWELVFAASNIAPESLKSVYRKEGVEIVKNAAENGHMEPAEIAGENNDLFYSLCLQLSPEKLDNLLKLKPQGDLN